MVANVAIEYRFAENQRERLPALAADLVGRKVAAIVATGGANVDLAAKAATTTIPIVFTFGGDPVKEGFVASLNRPGGNVSGVTFFNPVVSGKVLGLLHEILPNAAVIALMVNPNNRESLDNAARRPGGGAYPRLAVACFQCQYPQRDRRRFRHAPATSRRRACCRFRSILSNSSSANGRPGDAPGDPEIGFSREWVAEGGLMGYGNDIADVYRRAGLYTGRIIKGENAADLPVEQATNSNS